MHQKKHPSQEIINTICSNPSAFGSKKLQFFTDPKSTDGPSVPLTDLQHWVDSQRHPAPEVAQLHCFCEVGWMGWFKVCMYIQYTQMHNILISINLYFILFLHCRYQPHNHPIQRHLYNLSPPWFTSIATQLNSHPSPRTPVLYQDVLRPQADFCLRTTATTQI